MNNATLLEAVIQRHVTATMAASTGLVAVDLRHVETAIQIGLPARHVTIWVGPIHPRATAAGPDRRSASCPRAATATRTRPPGSNARPPRAPTRRRATA